MSAADTTPAEVNPVDAPSAGTTSADAASPGAAPVGTSSADRASVGTPPAARASADRAPVVATPVTEADHREQFLRAYLRHRVGERLAGFEQARGRYATARRWTTVATVLLFTAAAALGVVGVADPRQRALWAFLATVAAALAVAVTVVEAAFSFRSLARRSADGVALLHLVQAHGAPEGEDGVNAFRTEVESVLRHADR